MSEANILLCSANRFITIQFVEERLEHMLSSDQLEEHDIVRISGLQNRANACKQELLRHKSMDEEIVKMKKVIKDVNDETVAATAHGQTCRERLQEAVKEMKKIERTDALATEKTLRELNKQLVEHLKRNTEEQARFEELKAETAQQMKKLEAMNEEEEGLEARLKQLKLEVVDSSEKHAKATVELSSLVELEREFAEKAKKVEEILARKARVLSENRWSKEHLSMKNKILEHLEGEVDRVDKEVSETTQATAG